LRYRTFKKFLSCLCSVIGRKGTPFSHLQLMAQNVLPHHIYRFIGRQKVGRLTSALQCCRERHNCRTTADRGANLNVGLQFTHLNFCSLTTVYLENLPDLHENFITMYPWTNTSPSNFGTHPDPDSEFWTLNTFVLFYSFCSLRSCSTVDSSLYYL